MKKIKQSFAVKALSSAFIFCLAAQSEAASVTVQIDAYIDGSSFLKIQGNTIWWEHETFSAPGQWAHGDAPPPLPTVVNGHNWFPDWSRLPLWVGFEPCTATAPSSCASDKVSGLLPALSTGLPLSLTALSARGQVQLENPSAANDYTASIYFDDLYIGGADWYSIELTYDTPPVPVPAAAWLFGSGLLGLAGLKRRSA
jgi:hypothetical protein